MALQNISSYPKIRIRILDNIQLVDPKASFLFPQAFSETK
jgi:hypothetical protein